MVDIKKVIRNTSAQEGEKCGSKGLIKKQVLWGSNEFPGAQNGRYLVIIGPQEKRRGEPLSGLLIL